MPSNASRNAHALSPYVPRLLACWILDSNAERTPAHVASRWILIPGTPSGATVGGSVMNSCFRTVEAGVFTSTDKTALNALY